MPQTSRHTKIQFLHAAESGKFHQLQKILEQYCVTDVRDYYGNTPLILAARNGNLRTVKTLIDAGANIHACNSNGENALILSSREARLRMVSLLLEHGAQCDHHPIGNRRALVQLKPDENSTFRIRTIHSTSDPTWEPWCSFKKPSELRVKRVGRLMHKVVELLIDFGAEIDIQDDDNNTPLHNFIQCGDIDDCVRLLIKSATGLNAVNNSGATPLTEAIMWGKEDIALLLLESGADPNIGDWAKPIHLVASSALSPCFLRKLIVAGADVNIKDKCGMTTLYCTLRRWRDNREITQILLDAGADPGADDGKGFTLADHAMIAALDLEVSRKFSTNNCPDDFSPYQFPYNPSYARFIRAAKNCDFDALKAQIENQIPDKIKTLALFETIAQWKHECCQLLLDNGADPNGIGIDGVTPLTVAAAELEVDIAALLHSYGADLEIANCWGQKPLFLACQGGVGDLPEDLPEQRRLRMATLLLGRGADVEGADDQGWTPLRQAVLAANDIDLVRLLLQNGAHPERKDNSGVTPLQLAEQHCSSEMLTLLRKHMKR